MLSKIAVLVDAENISYRDAPRILEEAERLGQVVLKAVYGNWQRPDLQKWQEMAARHQFKIRHHTKNAKIKNSSDMQLIMDAMEVLYHTRADTFCLVTNDVDYVPLCDKLNASKRYVVGLGYKHAAEMLIRACDQFIFIGQGELPEQQEWLPPAAFAAANPPAPPAPAAQAVTPRPLPQHLIVQAFVKSPQDAQGWVALSALGNTLRQMQPGFNPGAYGHTTLTRLLQQLPELVEIQINGVSQARLRNVTARNLPELVKSAFARAPYDTDGWVDLSALGSAMRQLAPGFKPNTYGHATLAKLLHNLPGLVELREDGSGKSARLRT